MANARSMPLTSSPRASGDDQPDQLLRIGYIKVDRKGLFARDAYAAASEIDRVEDDPVKGDKVILKVPEDMLLQEASDG